MRSSHSLAGMQTTTFDEDGMVPDAGLVAQAALAQKLGVGKLVDEHGHLPAARWVGKQRHDSR